MNLPMAPTLPMAPGAGPTEALSSAEVILQACLAWKVSSPCRFAALPGVLKRARRLAS